LYQGPPAPGVKEEMNASRCRGGVFIEGSHLVLWYPCKLFGSRLVVRRGRSASSEWMSTCKPPNKEDGSGVNSVILETWRTRKGFFDDLNGTMGIPSRE